MDLQQNMRKQLGNTTYSANHLYPLIMQYLQHTRNNRLVVPNYEQQKYQQQHETLSSMAIHKSILESQITTLKETLARNSIVYLSQSLRPSGSSENNSGLYSKHGVLSQQEQMIRVIRLILDQKEFSPQEISSRQKELHTKFAQLEAIKDRNKKLEIELMRKQAGLVEHSTAASEQRDDGSCWEIEVTAQQKKQLERLSRKLFDIRASKRNQLEVTSPKKEEEEIKTRLMKFGKHTDDQSINNPASSCSWLWLLALMLLLVLSCIGIYRFLKY